MKKISLIFKNDADADNWLLMARTGFPILLEEATRRAVRILVSARRKKGKTL